MGKNRISSALRVILLAALLVLALGCAQASFAYNAGDPEFRAIYVDAWHAGCRNATEINQLIADAHYCNANTIVVQVRRRGDTIYPSIEPTCSGFLSSFDALADLIQKAHNTTPRLDVQAWFVVWPIASSGALPTNPNHPYKKYPQYLTKDDSGNTNIAGEYWFDPGHPGAEQYTYNLIMDVVNRYDVDGINFDYIRYGGATTGYNDVSVARFNSFNSRYGGNFSLWRRDQVTNFVRKVYANAIAVRPNIKITADCISQGGGPTDLTGFHSSAAYIKNYQDWPSWMQEGILDMSIPMTYFDCNGDYGYAFEQWVCFTRNYSYNRQCAPAPGVYSASCLISQLNITRNPSCGTPTNGAAIYAYASMDSSIKNAARSVWTTSAPIPAMTWKTSPTKGHIKGNVTFANSVWIDGALITLTGPASRSMYSDGTGFFAFIDLPQGDYTVTCVAPGYGTIARSVHVDVGLVTSADCDYPISTLTISNIAANETSSGAIVTWTTNAGSSSKVYYGLDRTCSSSTTEDSTQVTSHSVTLGGLLPGRTYYYKVYSLNPGAPSAMSTVCAFVTLPAAPADIIIESRPGGKNFAWYYDVNATGDSTAKSTATDCTSGIGSRYLSLSATYNKEAHYRPAISTAGSYKVWVTWGSSSGGSNIKHTVTYNGGNYTTSFNQSLNRNVWNLIGTFPFAAGSSGSCGEVKQWADALDGTNRILADAVKFSWLNTDTTAPSTPTSLAATSIQDDSITLGWTASTDNVGVAGYRVSRGVTSTSVSVVDSSATNAYVDNQVSPNTRYWYAISAYDTSGNKSGTTSTINMWSLCPKPILNTNITCNKQAGVWHAAGPFTFTAIGGFGAGFINYYRYVWDTSPSHTWTDTESSWVSGTKACTATANASPYYLHIRGYNQAAVPGEPSDLGPFYVDSTAPDAPTLTDARYTTSTSILYASWSAVDNESGIKRYEYAVGTSALGTQIRDWTSVGTDASVTIGGLSLSVGTTYFISVRAINNADLTSSPSSSTIAQSVANIQAAKALSTGSAVALPARVISAVYPTAFYIEEDDRTSGIRVQSARSLFPDQLITVTGTIGFSSDGERTILDPMFADPTDPGTAIKPLAIVGKAVGGGTQGLVPGVSGGIGLNSTGLLVKVAGKVTNVVSDGFYLDDGSLPINEPGNTGIKIWTGSPDSATLNTWVTVTGVVSLKKLAGVTYPQILKRN